MHISDVSFRIRGGGYFRVAHDAGSVVMSIGNGPTAQLSHLTPEEAVEAAHILVDVAARIMGQSARTLPTVADLRAHAQEIAEDLERREPTPATTDETPGPRPPAGG